ncbi:MAG: pirin family protein [Polyangiaceae bacterium]|nr:pirin family protein [Polyangiaceae bacterium]
MKSPILSVGELGFPWKTYDPFLFCVYHNDAYPEGNDVQGPNASLAGRELGMDFDPRNGWRMYHGHQVPGFPAHPHRGFETVTLVRKGFIDHSDSLGATARFGGGDTQWMTAGRGVVHAEMFPLRQRDTQNPLELFQIWLNLPRADKMVDPYFTMLWDTQIPMHRVVDEAGRVSQLRIVAGEWGSSKGPQPPPNSWASRPDSDLAIWTLKLDPHARLTLPPAKAGTNRTLYFFSGTQLSIAGKVFTSHAAVLVAPDVSLELENGPATSELLVLQGRPIGEPVVQHGPFVMNTPDEIREAFADYQRTGFGGWPWPSTAPVHPREQDRFAVHADGRREEP